MSVLFKKQFVSMDSSRSLCSSPRSSKKYLFKHTNSAYEAIFFWTKKGKANKERKQEIKNETCKGRKFWLYHI